MIRPYAWIAALAALLGAPAAAEQIDAASTVIGATLYPTGATVERAVTFAALAGRHEIVVDDLPLTLEADSLRVIGDGDAAFEILGINHRVDRPGLEPLTDQAREALEGRIRDLEWDLRAAESRRSAADSRLSYMDSFREATLRAGAGEEASAGLMALSARWREAWTQMSAEIAAAADDERTAARQVETLERDIAELRRELDRAGPPPPARGVVTISIAAAAPVAAGTVTISYLTPQASWSPLYDMRLDSSEATAPDQRSLRIIRRAAIRQFTGEDWPAVRLRLSTAQPSGRLAAAEPPIREAYLYQPEPASAALSLEKNAAEESDVTLSRAADRMDAGYMRNVLMAQSDAPAPPAEPVVATEASALASYDGAVVVYTIQEPLRAPGDGEVRQAMIGEETALTPVVARATPAVDPSAYLYAVYRNGDAPLLPGRAALYRDGAYFGQFDLSYVAPGDSTALPFGPLETLVVQHRVRDRVQGEEGLFTTSNRERSRFVISAKNLSDTPIRVTLFDSLPYTETKLIEVLYVGRDQPTERDVNGRRGALAWTFDLPAKEERAIEFGYDLSWPDGKRIELR